MPLQFQHTAPNQTPIDQSYTAPQGSGSPAIEDRYGCRKDGYLSLKTTYLPTSDEEHTNIQGDVDSSIDPEIGQISNIQKDVRETSDKGENNVYGVGHEISLCISDSVLTQLVKDELEEEWQKKRK